MTLITALRLLLLSTLLFNYCLPGKCCFLVKLSSFNGHKPLETPLIQWSIPSQNAIACGYLCHKHGGCESFSFNVLTSVCTGHSSAVNDIANSVAEPGSIYFHVSCNTSTLGTFHGFTYIQSSNAFPDALIPFEQVITFFGTSARLQSGTFTCPLSGYYKLLVNAYPQHLSQSAFVELQHNGQTKVSIKTTGNNLAGNGVILYLETSDHVGVYVTQTSSQVYGSPSERVTIFSAVFLSHQTDAVSIVLNANTTVLANNKVVFDHVITDVTNMYNITTGIVKIPTSGLYIVHFFILANGGVALDLYQNENIVCSASCHLSGQLVSCGNTAILRMVSGDELSLRSQQGFDNQLYGVSGKGYNTLTAHLIAAEQDMSVNSELDCWDGVDSKTYSGNISVTESGYNCQDWASQTPHAHNLTNIWKYPCDGSMAAALNRCRDPDWTGTPWCHTTDPGVRRQTCNITICPEERKAVAFSAALSQDIILNGDMQVRLDHIIFGEKCDYSPVNGKFTASIGGLYEFHVTAKGTSVADGLNLELWVRTNNVDFYIVTVKSAQTGGPTGGNSALVHLNPGDTVTVITASGMVNKLYGNSTELVCIFSGYLVK